MVDIMPRLDSHQSPVETMLREAGETALQWFGKVKPGIKSDGSPLTIADRKAEAVLVAHLTAAFPDDGICGEEGTFIQRSGQNWYVDPIDGTSAFIEGLAHWGPSVARVDGSHVRMGGFFMPRLNEMYLLAPDGTATRNGVTLKQLNDLGPTFEQRDPVLYIPSKLHRYVENIEWKGKCRCLGSIAAHLCLVAAGAAAATLVQPGWRIWDTAAGLGLIQALGGEARRLDGTPVELVAHEGIPFVAGRSDAVHWLTTQERIIPRSRLE